MQDPILRTKSNQRKNRVHDMPRKRRNYLHSEKKFEDGENVQLYGLKVRCQRRSRERCKQQSKESPVKMEGKLLG